MTPERFYRARVPFIQWSALTIFAALAVAWLWQRGVLSTVTHDRTGVVYLVAALFAVSMVRVGCVTWGLRGREGAPLGHDVRRDARVVKHRLSWPQLVASYSPLLGLLGTVAGLQMQISSGQGTDGLSTAFGCTLAGIFSSVVLGAAIHNCRVGLGWAR